MTKSEPEAPAAPDGERQDAVFFDGRSNKKRYVALRFGPSLEIVEHDATLVAWAYEDIRRVDAPDGVLRLTSATAPLSRLELRDPAPRLEIEARCRFLAGPGGRAAGTMSIILWSLAAAAAIVGMIWIGIPYLADRLAPFVPISWERRLGDAAEKQVRKIFPGAACRKAAGSAALDRLSTRLQSEAELAAPARIEVISSSLPNAFALPGGRVYLFSALLAKAEGPDEIAGVLAHEFGHLRHRDHLRRLIANGGTSYLAGLLFGDVTGAGALIFASRALLGAAHSREAEAQADAYAAALLARLGRPSSPLGALLIRIGGTESRDFGLLRDHPLSADRLAALAHGDQGETAPALLTSDEWAALKTICVR